MENKVLLFRVNGMPQGKARPRFTRQGRAYTPKKRAEIKKRISEGATAKPTPPKEAKPEEPEAKPKEPETTPEEPIS